MKTKYTIIVYSENRPGVLYRISGIILRRRINIEKLAVAETQKKGTSRFLITMYSDSDAIEKTIRQIEKIVEVTNVYQSDRG